MLTIYSFPYQLESNQYIEQQKAVWRGLGWQVKAAPTNVTEIFKCFFSKEKRSEKCIVLNWFEDAPTQHPKPLLKFTICCVYLFLIKLAFAKVVWVKHNFQPHHKVGLTYYKLLNRLMKICATDVVVHRPINESGVHYISHPEYPVHSQNSLDKDIPYLIFGSINRYKGVLELLEHWPDNFPLTIAGRCADKQLLLEIETLIAQRSLSVEWDNRFIPDTDLEQYILRSETVILSHNSDEMLVSGVFYHAASLGANILQCKNDFSTWTASQFNFAQTYTSDTLLAALNQQTLYSSEDIKQELNKVAGQQALMVSWQALIEKTSQVVVNQAS